MKLFSGIIAVVFCTLILMLSATAEMAEYVVFGMYPQSEAEETLELKNATFNEEGDALIGSSKYRRVESDDGFRYFLYEPVIWQKFDNILVARDVIDCKMYDEQEEKIKDFGGGIKYADSVTWEECSLRKWLNDEFASVTFTENERARISGEIRLMTVAEAKEKDKRLLIKNATAYAANCGIELKSNAYSDGDSKWLLMDVSPIYSGAVCTVGVSGGINTGITVLVNEPGIGVSPCIVLSDLSGLTVYTEELPEKTVEMYYPGGRTALFAENDVASAIANGWFTDMADAMNKNGLDMKARFASSALNLSYDWYLYNSKGKGAYISIDAEKENMTPAEVIAFVKPIMDTFYTGRMEDYMEVHVDFVYGKHVAASFSEFSDTVGKSIHEAAEACWSGWGNIVCSDGSIGRLTGTSGAKHTVTLRLKINSDGQYSLSKTHYNNTLHTLALEAKEYSSRPLGQLQYLRHYFGQNTIYDGRQFNNEPGALIENGVGVCGSYANFTADFCKLLGIPCIVLTNDSRKHAWNAVFIEDKWYHVDHTGSSDKETMRKLYSGYIVDTYFLNHNPDGFPDEHNAENVSFLTDSYLPVDNLSESDFAYVKDLFASSENTVTATPVEPILVSGEKGITVLLNGKKLDFDVEPVIENGRTLVPMRKIFESLGATVYWNDATYTATGIRGVTVVTISIDSAVMTKNGENIVLDVPARLINSRTMVPVRVIAESFGLTVGWDDATCTVSIVE